MFESIVRRTSHFLFFSYLLGNSCLAANFLIGNSYMGISRPEASTTEWYGVSGTYLAHIPSQITGTEVRVVASDIKSAPGYNASNACDKVELCYRYYATGSLGFNQWIVSGMDFLTHWVGLPPWEDKWGWSDSSSEKQLGPFLPGTTVEFFYRGFADNAIGNSENWAYTNRDDNGGTNYRFSVVSPGGGVPHLKIGSSYMAIRRSQYAPTEWYGVSGSGNTALPATVEANNAWIVAADVYATPGYNQAGACDLAQIVYRIYPTGTTPPAQWVAAALPFEENLWWPPPWQDKFGWLENQEDKWIGPIQPGKTVEFFFRGFADNAIGNSGNWTCTNLDNNAGSNYRFCVTSPTSSAAFSGKVANAMNCASIAGATVTWGTTSTVTDVGGTYRFDSVPCETRTLTVSKAGYQTSSQSYTPTCSASSIKNVVLSGSLAAPTVVMTMGRTNCIQVSWSSVYAATSYQVWKNYNGLYPPATQVATGLGQCSCLDTNTTAGQTTYYWVRAVNGSVTSAWSSAAVGTRLSSITSAPSAPTNVVASTNLTDRIEITWNSVPQAESYVVYRYEGPIHASIHTSDMIQIGQVNANTCGIIKLTDTNAIAQAEYYYCVQATNCRGATTSMGVLGYATGKPFVGVEWDTERTQAYFGDLEPIRVVQVVDTKNKAIRTGHPFAVRAYVRMPTERHRPERIDMRVILDSSPVAAATVQGTVYPRGLFRDWLSNEAMGLKQHAGLSAANIMQKGEEALTAIVPAGVVQDAGPHDIRVELWRTNVMLSATNTSVSFVNESVSLTVIRVKVLILFGGQCGPDESLWANTNLMLKTVRAVYPYKDISVTNAPLGLATAGVGGLNDFLDLLQMTKLSFDIAHYAQENMLPTIMAAEVRGEPVLVVGVLPASVDFVPYQGYTTLGAPIVVVRAESTLNNTLAHELGHVNWFDLGENYNWPGHAQGLSDFNPKATNELLRGDEGNYILPTMGPFNPESELTAEDASPTYAKTTPRMSSSVWRRYPFERIHNCLMGNGGSPWAEWNEYKRFCDVLLPGALEGQPMRPAKCEADGNGPLYEEGAEVGSYTGHVVMVSAVFDTTTNPVVQPLVSLGEQVWTPQVTTGNYAFAMADSTGGVMDVAWLSSSPPTSNTMFTVLLPYRAGAESVRLMDSNGVVLAEIHRSPAVPWVSNVICTATNGGLFVAWNVGDADGGPVWSSLYYASDATNFQGPLVSMTTNTSIVLPEGIVPGGTSTAWKVVASDGFNFGEGVSGAAAISNSRPVCVFASDFNDHVGIGVTNTFGCVARDAEDGTLSSNSVVWRLDGVIVATGYQARICSAIEGWRTLSATAADSQGATATCSTNVLFSDTNLTPVAAVVSNWIVALPGETVTMSSASWDPNGDPMTHSWLQVAGSNVVLSGANSTNASFAMPSVAMEGELRFRLTVCDGVRTGYPAFVSVAYLDKTIALDPTTCAFPYGGGSTSIAVTAVDRVPWTVENTNEWIRLLSSSSNEGFGTVSVVVETNNGTTAREGLLSIGSKMLSVQQGCDTDNDGMPDGWEITYGLDPNDPADAAIDSDGDRLPNLAEYWAGTNPRVADTDGDGLPDGWEVMHGQDPNGTYQTVVEHGNGVQVALQAYGVAVTGGYAFVAAGSNGLVVANVTTPTNPIAVASNTVVAGAVDVARAGQWAYLACGTGGVWCVDVANPTNPVARTHMGLPGDAIGLTVGADGLWVALGDSGIALVGTAQGTNLQLRAVLDTPGMASAVAVTGSYACVADGTNGLLVLNIAQPTNPVVTGHCPLVGMAVDVCLGDQVAFVALERSGVAVVNLANMTAPSLLATVGLDGWCRRIVLRGNHLFLASGGVGVEVLGVGNPAAPVLKPAIPTPGTASALDLLPGGLCVVQLDGLIQAINIDVLDSNLNGIPDSQELASFGYLVDDPNADSDGDGLSNRGEVLLGLNPAVKDNDGDGMPDGWEVANMLDPAKADAHADPDGDGLDNLSEYRAGTDPSDALSVLAVKDIGMQGGNLVIQWRGGTTATQHLMRCTNLQSNDWQTVHTQLPPTSVESTIELMTTNLPGAFYRVVVP